MRIPGVYLNLMAVMLLLSIASCRDNRMNQKPLIPLAKGNYWIYKGNCNTRPVTLNIRVTELDKRGTLTFAMLKGFPTDILNGEDWEPSEWGLLVTGDQHYYKCISPKTDSVRKSFLDNNNILAGLFSDSELFMEALYDTGQTFGEAAQMTREDGNYCWRVTERHAYDASAIRGLKILGPFDRYTLAFKTLADDMTIDMVPRIGMVRYRYCHHGTTCELDIKLVEAGLK